MNDVELELRQCKGCFTMKNFAVHSKEGLCFRCLDRAEAKREIKEELIKEIKALKEKESPHAGYSRVEASMYSFAKGFNSAIEKIIKKLSEEK